jgi:hypothetical protein
MVQEVGLEAEVEFGRLLGLPQVYLPRDYSLETIQTKMQHLL